MIDTNPPATSDASGAAAKPEKQKKQKVKRPPLTPEKKKKFWIGGGIGILMLLIIVGMMPAQGSMQYGICKIFVELNDPYPLQIRPLSVDDYAPLGGPVKMTYKRVDPFGIESVNTIECHFKKDENGSMLYELESVDINGKARPYNAENPDIVARFNTGLSAIIANEPDRNFPAFSLDDIAGYKDSTE